MFVYVVKAFHEKEFVQVKVGWAVNVSRRLAELQTGSPVELRLIGEIACRSKQHARELERTIHRMFVKQRRRGEWFRLSQKHLAMLERVIEKAASAERVSKMSV